jgi:hypothetical protein
MAIIQSIIGSSYQFSSPTSTLNGGEAGVANAQPGFIKRLYSGYYFSDNANQLDTTSPTSISVDTNPIIFNVGTNYSVQWTGYFYANLAGNYTFKTTSDDASWVWMGNAAISGFDSSNAIINNGGLHGNNDAYSATYTLSGATYYPIRIMFGQADGGDVFNMSVDYNGYGYGYIGGSQLWSCSTTPYGFNTF